MFDASERLGPVYPNMPGLDKWRRAANSHNGCDRVAYGRAVLAAIGRLNKPPGSKPVSLKSTAWTKAKGRAAAIAQFERDAQADRAKRTNAQIIKQYHEHMKQQRIKAWIDNGLRGSK